MTTGWTARTARAAVFAAVCVLLTALGHTVMSGTSLPWWAVGAGAVATGGTSWLLAGRERRLLFVVWAAVVTQAVLHSLFSLAQVVAHPQASGPSVGERWLNHLLCRAFPASPAGSDPAPAAVGLGSMDHASHAAHSPGAAKPTDDMGSAEPMGSVGSADVLGSLAHGMGGVSPGRMLMAHLLAAVLSGLWLAHGERAVFRTIRAFAGWLMAPLRLPVRLPTPPHRLRGAAPRAESGRAPCLLFLTYAITSRGPPAGSAVA